MLCYIMKVKEMSNKFIESLEKELQNPDLKKEWDDLEVENKLDYADDFAKNHNERLSHDEVFKNARSRINKV